MFKKENLRRNFLRVKQNIDQNLGRAERSEVLSEDQQENEKRVDVVKHAFQNISKKAMGTVQAPGSDFDKRLKKLPETGLGQALIESACNLGTNTLLGSSCHLCGECQVNLAKEKLQYETTVEQEFISPLQNIVEVDIPAILKHRKALNKSTLDMDSAKTRFHQAVRQSSVPGANIANAAAKADVIREELDEASAKVETIKDNLSIELCNFAAKESDHTQKLFVFLEAQANYHKKALEAIQLCMPQLREAILNSPVKPCYGIHLDEHLRLMCRDIAVVLEVCILTLLETGMEEEGLFRIAGSAIKVKKLKASFDAQAVDIDEYETDPHTVAGALKQYLRELPEPLLTYDLHDEFMQAASRPPESRLEAIRTVINKLPTTNYNNFRYLIKFLAKLKEKSDINKMKASNIAIVIGPNLLWSKGSDSPSMLTTGTLSSIIEAAVTHADFIFPGVIDFHLTAQGASPKLSKEPSRIIAKEQVQQESMPKVEKTDLLCQSKNANSEKKLSLSSKPVHDLIGPVPEICCEEDNGSSSDENNPFSEKYLDTVNGKLKKQDTFSEKQKAASVIDTSTGDYDNIMYTSSPQSSLYRSNTVTSLYPVKGGMEAHKLYGGRGDQYNQPIRPSKQFKKLSSTPSFQGYSRQKQCPPFPLFYDSVCDAESSSNESTRLSEPSPRHLAGSTPNISIYSKSKPEDKTYLNSQSSYWNRPSHDYDSLNYHSLKRGSAPSIISPPSNFLSHSEASSHPNRRSGPAKISRSQLGQPPPPRQGAGHSPNELSGDSSKSAPLMSRPMDKSFHEDTYETAFALASLGAGDTSSDYLTKVRAMWDDHHSGNSSISRENSPGSNLTPGSKGQSPKNKLGNISEHQVVQDQEKSKPKEAVLISSSSNVRPITMEAGTVSGKKKQEIDFTNVGYRYEEDRDKSPVPNQVSTLNVDGQQGPAPGFQQYNPSSYQQYNAPPTIYPQQYNANSGLSSPVSNNSSSSSSHLVPSDSPEVSSPVPRRSVRKPAPPPPPERPFTVMVTAATTPATKADSDLVHLGVGDSGNVSRPAPLASPETCSDVPDRHEKHKSIHTERPSMPPPERPKLPPPVTIVPGRGHQRSASTGAMMMSNTGGGGGGDGASGIPNAGTMSSYNIASSSGEGSTTPTAAAEEAQNTLSPLPAGMSHTLGRSVSLRPRQTPPPPPPPVAKESEDTKL